MPVARESRFRSVLGRLRRRTVAERYIPAIDGLRFVAIIAVVLVHIFGQERTALFPDEGASLPQHPIYYFFVRMVWHGARGVPLFFAISGFILALPFARHRFLGARPVSLSFYFLRRVTRLEPPYLLMLLLRLPLLMLAAPALFGYYWRHFAASALYIHNLVYALPSVINPPAWSLEIEIQFYCLVPLLAYYFAIRKPVLRRALMVVAMAALGVAQVVYLSSSPRADLSILMWIQYFFAGFVIADLYLTDWQRIREHWLWELTLPLWPWIFLSERRWFHAMMPFALILLFIAAFKGPLQRRFFGNAFISMTGGMCYSLYLTHTLVLTAVARVLQRLTIHIPAVLVWAGCLLAVYLCGLVFYLLIERPCMDPAWPRRLWRRFFPGAISRSDAAV